jgi:cystathionine gamma-synthase
MAAQFSALRALNRRRPGKRTVQLGFPYVDTLKVQERLGCGGYLLHHLETVREDLARLLARETIAGCFSEIPGNPLLGSADLRQITPVLREQHVPLVADDVVATPYNIDLSQHADLIATSLTKFLAGSGDVMGGALICNPRSPLYGELKPLIVSAHEELLYSEDEEVLSALVGGFPDRMEQHNRNGLFIAEQLRAHPRVERVWFPKWEHCEAYEGVRRPGRGWGALITFLIRNAKADAPRIYDALPVCKGPSLGTVFSLACPFTLLAHYTELNWAEACGVPSHLIRLSVGLEDPSVLWSRIKAALET